MAVNSYQPKRTVSAIAVIDLANELLERQIIKQQYLKEMGPDFLSLYAAWKHEPIQEYRLPEALLVSLWQQADIYSKDFEIGLKIGSRVNLQAKGVLANWLSQCDTLSEAFSVFSQNIALLNPSEYWQKVEEGDLIKLVLRFNSSIYPSIAVDRSMAAIITWSRALSSEAITPISVCFERPEPKKINTYITLFGETTKFGQIENCLYLTKDSFEQTIKQANPYLKGILAQQAMVIRTQLSETNKRSMLDAVNTLLIEDLMQFCHIEATCKKLHISRSSLYRKLKVEGTSFTELVKKARLTKLRTNTSGNITHQGLTESLGFEDIGSYYRFRKLYT
jgi:AraC-like DNA-binding protein